MQFVPKCIMCYNITKQELVTMKGINEKNCKKAQKYAKK